MPTNTYKYPLPNTVVSNGSDTAIKLLPLKIDCNNGAIQQGLTLEEILTGDCNGGELFAIPVCAPCFVAPGLGAVDCCYQVLTLGVSVGRGEVGVLNSITLNPCGRTFYINASGNTTEELQLDIITKFNRRFFPSFAVADDTTIKFYLNKRWLDECDCTLQTVSMVRSGIGTPDAVFNCDCITGVVPPVSRPATNVFSFKIGAGNYQFDDITSQPIRIDLGCGITIDLGEMMLDLWGAGPHDVDFFFGALQGYFRSLYVNSDLVYFKNGANEREIAFYLSPTDFPGCSCANGTSISFTGFSGFPPTITQPFFCFEVNPEDFMQCGNRAEVNAPCILPDGYARLKVQTFPPYPGGLGTYRFIPGFLDCDALSELPCVQPPTHLDTNNRLKQWLEAELFPAFPQHFGSSYIEYVNPSDPTQGFYIYLDLSKRDWCRDTWKVCECSGDLSGFTVSTELYCCPVEGQSTDTDACPVGFAKAQITIKNDPDYVWNNPFNDAGFVIRGLIDNLTCGGVNWNDIPTQMRMSEAGNFSEYLANVYNYLRSIYEVLGNSYLVLNEALGTIYFFLDAEYFIQNLGIDLCTRTFSLCQAGYHTNECAVPSDRMRLVLDMQDYVNVNDLPAIFNVFGCLALDMSASTLCFPNYDSNPFTLAQNIADWINNCFDATIIAVKESVNLIASTNGKLLYIEWDGDCCGSSFTVESYEGMYTAFGVVECCPAEPCTSVPDGYARFTFTIGDPDVGDTLNGFYMYIGDPFSPCFSLDLDAIVELQPSGIDYADELHLALQSTTYTDNGITSIHTNGTNVITIQMPMPATCCGETATLQLTGTGDPYLFTAETECCPGNCQSIGAGMAQLCFKVGANFEYGNPNTDASFFLQPDSLPCDPPIIPELSIASVADFDEYKVIVASFFSDLATTIGGGSSISQNGNIFCLTYNVANFQTLFGYNLCLASWIACTQSATPVCMFYTRVNVVFGLASESVTVNFKATCSATMPVTYETITVDSGADIDEFITNLITAWEALSPLHYVTQSIGDPTELFFYLPCSELPCTPVVQIAVESSSGSNYLNYNNLTDFGTTTPDAQTVPVEIISDWCCPFISESSPLPVQTLDLNVSKQPECCPPEGCAYADLEFELRNLVPDENDNVAWALVPFNTTCPVSLTPSPGDPYFVFSVEDYSTFPSLNSVLQSFVGTMNDAPNQVVTVTGNRMRIRVSRAWWLAQKGVDFCTLTFKVCSVGIVSDLVGNATIEITQQPLCCGEDCGKPCPDPDKNVIKIRVRNNGMVFGTGGDHVGLPLEATNRPCVATGEAGYNSFWWQIRIDDYRNTDFTTYFNNFVAIHNLNFWPTNYGGQLVYESVNANEGILTITTSRSAWQRVFNSDICKDGIRFCPNVANYSGLDWEIISNECCSPPADCPDIIDPPPPKVYDLCCGTEPEKLYFQFNIPDRINDYDTAPTAGWQETKSGNWFATVEAIDPDGNIIVPLSSLALRYYVGRDRKTERTYQGIEVNTEFLPNCFFLRFTFRTLPRETVIYSPLYRKTNGCCEQTMVFEALTDSDCSGHFYGLVDQFIGTPFKHIERLRMNGYLLFDSYEVTRQEENGRVISSTGQEVYRLVLDGMPPYVVKRFLNILTAPSFLIDNVEYTFDGTIDQNSEFGYNWWIDIKVKKKAFCEIIEGCG